MRAKSQKRTEAESLRREQGLSYSEIAALTGISKSTLSNWLRDIALGPGHQARLQQRLQDNRAAFAARAWPINRERHARNRRMAWELGCAAAASLPALPCVDELAFAMLYLGEGSKTGNRVQIGSTEPHILRYSLWVLTEVYGVLADRISCRVHLVEAARVREAEIIGWWMTQLCVQSQQFQQTTYDRRRREVELTEDYHGVCLITHHDTYLQQRILGLADAFIRSRGGAGSESPDAQPPSP